MDIYKVGVYRHVNIWPHNTAHCRNDASPPRFSQFVGLAEIKTDCTFAIAIFDAHELSRLPEEIDFEIRVGIQLDSSNFQGRIRKTRVISNWRA